MSNKTAFVTGAAGFIGSHLVDRLLRERWNVIAFDNFDPFYDRAAKEHNVAAHRHQAGYTFVEGDIRDVDHVRAAIAPAVDVIVHLAACVGVRPSIADPLGYQEVNVRGTQNMLEAARAARIRQFVFASSSSVYGINPHVPWTETDHVLQPISPYASTKVSGELLGHVYSHLYGMRFIALRFFTVYGPRQRPDLAIHAFAKRMMEGRPIPVFGDGSTRRDYTYVEDIVAGVRAALDYDATPYEVINLGNNQTVTLAEMIAGLEEALGVTASIERLPEQPGDVPQTWASIEKAERLLAYSPKTAYRDGVRQFVDWFRSVRRGENPVSAVRP
jgi:UDP-glucuronate 4-epimerase